MADVEMWQKKEVRDAFIEQAQAALAKRKDELQGTDGTVAIEPESGDIFTGATLGQANEAAFKKYPDRWLYFVRLDDPEAAMPLPTW
jgi:hypothetical protein